MRLCALLSEIHGMAPAFHHTVRGFFVYQHFVSCRVVGEITDRAAGDMVEAAGDKTTERHCTHRNTPRMTLFTGQHA